MNPDMKTEVEEIKRQKCNGRSETVINEEKNINTDESIRSRDIENKGNKPSKTECFQCKVCPYNTFRKPFLDKHMLQKHGFSKINVEKKHEEICYSEKMDFEIINTSGKMLEEKQQSDSSKSNVDNVPFEFLCSQCDYKTRHLSLLNIHQEVHEDEEAEVFKCIQCEFQTEEIGALQEHEKSHKKLILFHCPKCDYATRQKCNLRAHMRVHEDPEKLKKFFCKTCTTFGSFHYSALLRHIKLKHGIEGTVFKCDKCPFTAKIQRLLLNHQRTHTSPDMFKCEKCDFVTCNEQTIQRHVQRHEIRQRKGEEVIIKEQFEGKEIIWFCCNLCDFRSKDQRYVILHKKVHTRVDEINRVGENIVQPEGEKNNETRKGDS